MPEQSKHMQVLHAFQGNDNGVDKGIKYMLVIMYSKLKWTLSEIQSNRQNVDS